MKSPQSSPTSSPPEISLLGPTNENAHSHVNSDITFFICWPYLPSNPIAFVEKIKPGLSPEIREVASKQSVTRTDTIKGARWFNISIPSSLSETLKYLTLITSSLVARGESNIYSKMYRLYCISLCWIPYSATSSLLLRHEGVAISLHFLMLI